MVRRQAGSGGGALGHGGGFLVAVAFLGAPVKAQIGQDSGNRDCQVTDWTAWTSCTPACTHKRIRTVSKGSSGTGAKCPSLIQTESCTGDNCKAKAASTAPARCSVSGWSAWSMCSKTCGLGTRTRTRAITGPIPDDASNCGLLQEVANCKSNDCSSDCRVKSWDPWSQCSATCGTGSQTRKRQILTKQAGSGAPCPALAQTANCHTELCPSAAIDCVVSSWQSWGACSATCGTGTMTRTRTVKTSPNAVGQACSTLIDTQNCATAVCNVDCVVGSWADWGQCSPHPADPLQPCISLRTRPVKTPPVAGGQPCPKLYVAKNCGSPNCVSTAAFPFNVIGWQTLLLLALGLLALIACLCCVICFALSGAGQPGRKRDTKNTRAVEVKSQAFSDDEAVPLLDMSKPVVAGPDGTVQRLDGAMSAPYLNVPTLGSMQVPQLRPGVVTYAQAPVAQAPPAAVSGAIATPPPTFAASPQIQPVTIELPTQTATMGPPAGAVYAESPQRR